MAEIIFLPVEEWEARARDEGYWRELGMEEELGDFYDGPDTSPVPDMQPVTDDALIHPPKLSERGR